MWAYNKRLGAIGERLRRQHPDRVLLAHRDRATSLLARLHREWALHEQRRRERLAAAIRALENISPQRTLERGYAIMQRDADGMVLRSPQQVNAGDAVTATLAGGKLPLRVRAADAEKIT